MEHIFHKIILNIYFDYIHIMCLYRVFSVHCTDYTLVICNEESPKIKKKKKRKKEKKKKKEDTFSSRKSDKMKMVKGI
jgi:hypothetical protein